MSRIYLTRILLLCIVAFSLLMHLRHHWPHHWKLLDDAYMSIRYANHWLNGDGFSWNPADGKAYGITSASHLFLVTLMRGTTDLSDNAILSTISWGAGIAAIIVLVTAGFLLFKELRLYWLPLLVIPSMIFGGMLSVHSRTGMETTCALLFNALLASASILFARTPSKLNLSLCLVAAYLVFMTRPDMGLYCVLLPSLLLLSTDKSHWRTAIAYILLFGVIGIADLALKKELFGDFLPLPFYAKASGFYKGYLGRHLWNVGAYMFRFFQGSLPFVLTIVCFTPRSKHAQLATIFFPLLLTFGYYATVVQIMGFEARYYYPSMTFIIFAAFISVDAFLKEHRSESIKTPDSFYVRGVVMFILLTLANSTLVETTVKAAWQKLIIGEPERFVSQKFPTLESSKNLPRLGRRTNMIAISSLLNKLPAGILISASEHGYLGAQNSQKSILDTVGLHDRHIAHQGFSPEYFFSRKPDIIWMATKNYSYTNKEILDSPSFEQDYTFFPSAYNLGLAIRKDSKYRDQIYQVLEQEFRQVYPGFKISDYEVLPTIESTEESGEN